MWHSSCLKAVVVQEEGACILANTQSRIHQQCALEAAVDLSQLLNYTMCRQAYYACSWSQI